LRIDRESLWLHIKFMIGSGAFMLTQSREHGTRERESAGASPTRVCSLASGAA